MSDLEKTQKLASARKKFKELKKQKNAIQKGEKSGDNNHENTEIQMGPLTQYFHSVVEKIPEPIAFFDNIHTEENSEENKNEKDIFKHTVENSPKKYFDEHDYSVALEYEDLKPNELFELHKNKKAEELETPPQHSTIESLHQLSSLVDELVKPNEETSEQMFESELEIRNQQLAAMLNEEKIKSQQLEAALEDSRSRFVQMENEFKSLQATNEVKSEQEVQRLKEELQAHVQTLGILVAEKAELTANTSQLHLSLRQKNEEYEESQTRLRASRSRVAELERELAQLKNTISQNHYNGEENNEAFEKLHNEYQLLRNEKDELLQDLLEVKEKLKHSSKVLLDSETKIHDLSGQLGMANIKIQQLTNGQMNQNDVEIQNLVQEKFLLEKQINELMETLKKSSKEREESNLHYQQYAQQLNSQLSNLAVKLEELRQENETLHVQEQNRIKHISELEKQLQNLQDDQNTLAKQNNYSDLKMELEQKTDLIENLNTEKHQLCENYDNVLSEKTLLIQELEKTKQSVKHLEDLLEQFKGNQTDNVKLLAAMESDKVAAARAMAQNNELKKQLEGMQEAFVKLNNDKLELTEKLSIEQRNNRDFMEKIQKTDKLLLTLTDAIEIKDKELSHLRENSHELNKQVLHSEQLNDRLRHYESLDHSTHSLQHELQEAQKTIEILKNELIELKQRNKSIQSDNINDAIINYKLENLNNMENNDLEDKIQHEKNNTETIKQFELMEYLDNLKENQKINLKPNRDNLSNLDKESAMKHLEEKFLQTMENIAILTEEKERLEHLVLQLQGETETIGEYVALYQQQRSLLKQKAIEKDQQLTQLASDRELIKEKLEKLRQLVEKLVLENGVVPSELLHHEALNEHSKLCTEHAKLHNEINKITIDNLKSSSQESHNTEIAEEIIGLLSEIKSSNLVQPSENFHHCPWCSGKLITV